MLPNIGRTLPTSLVAALWLASPAALAQSAPELEVRSTADGASLYLGAQQPFHTTTAQVHGARRIEIPGKRPFAIVWQETGASGETSSHYALSLDGRGLATVRETSYDILMRRGHFDPLVEAPDLTGSALPPGGDVYFVQFYTQTLQEYRDVIGTLGGDVYNFVSNHTHLVRMDPSVRNAVAALPFVRWVGAYHTEFRLDGELLSAINAGTLGTAKYNVMVFERGIAQKQLVADAIAALGGSHDALHPAGLLLEATLTAEQLGFVASMDAVQWIDAWGEAETDMNVARDIGGANYVEGLTGYSGEGVRAEVMDVGTNSSHTEYSAVLVNHNLSGSNSHGTSTHGINFARGANASARGMLPDVEAGIAASNLGGGPRYTHTAELVDPFDIYKGVYQSNSWGDPRTTQYTSKSTELDDIIFINDIIICQSQSNAGNQDSRPQAWAKNIVSVGGVRHQNTLSKADDNWSFGGSIGPAADGRIKPDLTHFYDNIFTTTGTSGSSYTSGFGGTSGATPITAGHFGLFFQMWHNGIFGNPTAGTVFASRPHSTTAKAMVINTASSYPFSGLGHDLTRSHQGWGLPDLARMYDDRNKTHVIDETDVLSNLESTTYGYQVSAGEPEFKATLVYLDRSGTTSSSQHRINDLDLRVQAPDGTVYWGNNGLHTGNWSTSGGSANKVDTVENVFVQNPMVGQWQVEIIAAELNQDTHVETGALDADYALVVRGHSGVVPPCDSALVTYCTAKSGLTCGIPAISTFGQPNINQASGFFLFAGPARSNKSGLLIYTNQGRDNSPFLGGTLCINTPLRRAPTVNSGGALTCDGEFSIDMNAYASGAIGGNPAAYLSTPGNTITAQWWGRDSIGTGSFLSNGVEWVVCP